MRNMFDDDLDDDNRLATPKDIAEVEKEKLVDKYKTALSKGQLINEIKKGLGEEIKKNPNRVKVIEKTWSQKLGLFFKKMFTKF